MKKECPPPPINRKMQVLRFLGLEPLIPQNMLIQRKDHMPYFGVETLDNTHPIHCVWETGLWKRRNFPLVTQRRVGMGYFGNLNRVAFGGEHRISGRKEDRPLVLTQDHSRVVRYVPGSWKLDPFPQTMGNSKNSSLTSVYTEVVWDFLFSS